MERLVAAVLPSHVEGTAGVESDAQRRSGDERVVREPVVEEGVRDDHDLVAATADAVPAEGNVAGRLAGGAARWYGTAPPLRRLEPLPVLVHQTDEHKRHVEGLLDLAGDGIEALLAGRRVEDVETAQGRQPGFLVGGEVGRLESTAGRLLLNARGCHHVD